MGQRPRWLFPYCSIPHPLNSPEGVGLHLSAMVDHPNLVCPFLRFFLLWSGRHKGVSRMLSLGPQDHLPRSRGSNKGVPWLISAIVVSAQPVNQSSP